MSVLTTTATADPSTAAAPPPPAAVAVGQVRELAPAVHLVRGPFGPLPAVVAPAVVRVAETTATAPVPARPAAGRHRPAAPAATAPARRVRRPAAYTPPPVAGDVGVVLAYAYAALGRPYVFGAAGPYAYDCSGLILASYARIGVRLPHKAADLAHVGRAVPLSDIRAGDILIFRGGKHAGLAIGGGWMIHASKVGQPVAKVRIYTTPDAVRRITT